MKNRRTAYGLGFLYAVLLFQMLIGLYPKTGKILTAVVNRESHIQQRYGAHGSTAFAEMHLRCDQGLQSELLKQK